MQVNKLTPLGAQQTIAPRSNQATFKSSKEINTFSSDQDIHYGPASSAKPMTGTRESALIDFNNDKNHVTRSNNLWVAHPWRLFETIGSFFSGFGKWFSGGETHSYNYSAA